MDLSIVQVILSISISSFISVKDVFIRKQNDAKLFQFNAQRVHILMKKLCTPFKVMKISGRVFIKSNLRYLTIANEVKRAQRDPNPKEQTVILYTTAPLVDAERVMVGLEGRCNFAVLATHQRQLKIALDGKTRCNFDPLFILCHELPELQGSSMFCACFKRYSQSDLG